jgi:hypothetical protein
VSLPQGRMTRKWLPGFVARREEPARAPHDLFVGPAGRSVRVKAQENMHVIIHHRETAARPLAAKHEISNPKSEADGESWRDATFLRVVGVDGNREDFREFFQAMLDPFFGGCPALLRAGTCVGRSE